MPELRDYLNAINHTKERLLDSEDEDWEKKYPPFIVNKCVYPFQDTIMLVNEIYNIATDWPIPQSLLEAYITQKYGAGNEFAIHNLYGRPHYESPIGKVVDASYIGASPVTNTEYETRINDAKSRIRLVDAKLIDVFVKDLGEAF